MVSYPSSVRSLVLAFRVALVFLSALCSVMYLAHKLDRPHLEAIRTSDLQDLEQEYAVELHRLYKERQSTERQLARSLRERYQRLVQPVNERYQPGIQELEGALNAEMDNAVGGKFAGPRLRLELAMNARADRFNAEMERRLEALSRYQHPHLREREEERLLKSIDQFQGMLEQLGQEFMDTIQEGVSR